MEETTRLFVALRPPAEVRAHLARIQAELDRALPFPLRWAPEDQLHLTLLFAPAFPTSKIEALVEAVAAVCGPRPPFEIALGPPEARPARGVPRVLWMPAFDETGALAGLHESLRRSAHAIAPHASPSAPKHFHPHLTLARFPRGAPRHAARLVASAPEVQIPAPWSASALELVASRIANDGAHHTPLQTFPLAK